MNNDAAAGGKPQSISELAALYQDDDVKAYHALLDLRKAVQAAKGTLNDAEADDTSDSGEEDAVEVATGELEEATADYKTGEQMLVNAIAETKLGLEEGLNFKAHELEALVTAKVFEMKTRATAIAARYAQA
jgi:hypothetical protein